MAARGTERSTTRLEAFTDAVFAIAITLPVTQLELPPTPPGGDLAAAYARLAPDYVAYALSVAVIGLYWVTSHFAGKITRETDHIQNLMTVVLLAFVSVTPVATAPLTRHWDDANGPVAAQIYAGLLAIPTVIWMVRWLYSWRGGMLDPHLDPAYVRTATIRNGAVTLTVVIGFGLTFVWWPLGLGVIGLTILTFAIPPKPPVYKPGEEPDSEVQEPEERD